MKRVQATITALALSACNGGGGGSGGDGVSGGGNTQINDYPQGNSDPIPTYTYPQFSCELHVYCREVTDYPVIENARPGTREALTPSITSSYAGRTYAVSVYLPAIYHESASLFPVIYSLDGDTAFSYRADEIDHQQKEVILVSIHADDSRYIDYVYFDANGNKLDGQNFFNYLVYELGPFVEGSYRIDPNRRALEGHSHGGNFVVYSLFTDVLSSRYFKTYVAQEPSIWIHEASLNELEARLSNEVSDLDSNVYLSSSLPGDPMVSNGGVTEALYGYLNSRGFENLDIHYYSYDLDHGAMSGPAFADFLHDHYQ